eukprot:CAMPEP_0185784170 /NCGR_PEP_ID=MMETSP1174-20130828/121363_1 /TAXON_ID=35687 /ORGANISM="Dictyocha speculum, Strain CCMP1381" /LENGTH=382 /DNA_ID=CAMNT_0028475589 /DNA_START=237 /DNA_END=1381 /DNA_ORIENTATION=+
MAVHTRYSYGCHADDDDDVRVSLDSSDNKGMEQKQNEPSMPWRVGALADVVKAVFTLIRQVVTVLGPGTWASLLTEPVLPAILVVIDHALLLRLHNPSMDTASSSSSTDNQSQHSHRKSRKRPRVVDQSEADTGTDHTVNCGGSGRSGLSGGSNEVCAAAWLAMEACGTLEAIMTQCGPLIGLTLRQQVDAVVGKALVNIRALTRPMEVENHHHHSKQGWGTHATNTATTHHTTICPAICCPREGAELRRAVLELGTCVALSPRCDGALPGLGGLLADAADAVVLTDAGSPLLGATAMRTRSVIDALRHPRTAALSLPHFWPTNAADTLIGRALAEGKVQLPSLIQSTGSNTATDTVNGTVNGTGVGEDRKYRTLQTQGGGG